MTAEVERQLESKFKQLLERLDRLKRFLGKRAYLVEQN